MCVTLKQQRVVPVALGWCIILCAELACAWLMLVGWAFSNSCLFVLLCLGDLSHLVQCWLL